MILGLCLTANLSAQTYGDWEWPSATLVTDKNSYELYEPVMVTFTVTNTDTLSHSYREPTSIPEEWIWTLSSPSGEEVDRHGYDASESWLPPPAFARGLISYQPDMSRDVTFLLQASWPTWGEVGTYTLSVATSHPDDYYDQQELASVQFEVLDAAIPQGAADTLELIDKYCAFRNGYSCGSTVFNPIAASEALQDRSDIPDQAEEWVLIAAALAEGLRCADCASAQTLYDAFLMDHGNSGYAIIAEVGVGQMMLSRGETHPPIQFDRYREVRVKVFLEGAYSGPSGDTVSTWTSFVTAMGTTMLEANGPGDNQTPYSDPPWSQRPQTGDGSGTDWVLITLVDSMLNIAGQRVAVVGRHGQVRANVLNPTSDGPFWIVVDHRNHVAVMSDTMVSFRGPLLLHDFTTGHAYEEPGDRAQKKKPVAGGDTVYVMFAGDGNADGLVTAPDFNLWNAATTAGATGYQASDYGLDSIVTAPDFNLWNANTTAGAESAVPPGILNVVFSGSSLSSSLESLSPSEDHRSFVRLKVRKDTGNDFWLDVEVRADASLAPTNTIASGVVDVFYDETELTPEDALYDFLAGRPGYVLSKRLLQVAAGHLVRLQFTSDGINPGTGYNLGTGWELLATLYFDRSPPKRDDGTSIRMRSLHLGFYDSPGNQNGSDRVIDSLVEVQ